MLKHILRSLVLLSFLGPGLSFSQQPAPPPPDAAQTTELIRKAGLRRAEYREGFKDLTAEETQRVEEYGDKGLNRRREIVSDLIIYQSQLDNSFMAEYRNVRAVDGKEVAGRDRRVEQLFGRLAKVDSTKKELERLNREGKRYDLNFSAYGQTLNQGLPLDERVSPYYRFNVNGREQIDGHDTIVVEYQQVTQDLEQQTKLSLPEKLKGAEALYRGRLWLDQDTARLRREERELTLKHPLLPAPLTMWRFEFSYRDSRFGILTPTRIVFSAYSRGRDGAGGALELSLGGRVVFEYGEFQRFDVASPDSRLDAPGNRQDN
ncbi:MAG: hypothetical protein QOH49_3709 [Acidobacteriota bacterium]|jgi:hypothetical protein|nr:hypothetical protein [Acidobacteriota bacterium]